MTFPKVNNNRKPNTLCTQWNEIDWGILAIKSLYPGKPTTLAIRVLFHGSGNIARTRSFAFFPMAVGKLPVLLVALALGTTTLSASREVRTINEATKNTFRCKFNNNIFWLPLIVGRSSSLKCILLIFPLMLNFIEEIRAAFVFTGFSKRLKQLICELDVSASTFFFSYTIQTSAV